MEETKGQQRIRYMLLAVCILLVIGAFFLQQRMLTDNKALSFNAGVLQVGTSEQPPVVAVTKMVEGDPSLILYRLDPTEKFKFHSVDAKRLTSMPEEIMFTNRYVFVKMNKDWYYYNEDTSFQKSPIIPQARTNSVNFTVQKKEGLFEVHLENNMAPQPVFQLDKEPRTIQLLNESPKVWLAIFEESITILDSYTDK